MSDGCVKCGSSYVTNKKYCLCDNCNFIRLHGKNKFEYELDKQRNKSIVKKKKSSVISNLKQERIDKRKEELRLDEEVYYEVFCSQPNKCAECETELPDIFRDSNGFVIDRYQYSHILSKGAYPEFRRNKKNFNRLCQRDHTRWESGDRENMKIFKMNQEIIQELFDEQISKGSI